MIYIARPVIVKELLSFLIVPICIEGTPLVAPDCHVGPSFEPLERHRSSTLLHTSSLTLETFVAWENSVYV